MQRLQELTVIKFFKDMITDRAGGTNSKIFWGSIFAIVLIVALFVGTEATLYQTLAFCMLSLFGISAVDNLTAPKIEVNKTETSNKESKTTIDVAETIKQVKKKK